MALISSVAPITSRAAATAPQGTAIAHSTAAVAVHPVPAASASVAPQPQSYPHLPPTALAARPIIAVDGIPSVQDEAVLADDIIRPSPRPDPQPEQTAAAKPQTLPPQVAVPQVIVPAQDPHRTAQATPWPESLRILRILRAPAPADPQTG